MTESERWPKALIVENEGIVALDLSKRLHDLGYEITAVTHSGQKAILLARENPPDLVIIDSLNKSDQDCTLTAITIQRLFEWPLPFIFLTAFSFDESQLTGMIRCSICLRIPFSDKDLVWSLEQAKRSNGHRF